MVCVRWGKKRDERTEGQGDSRIRKFDCHERVFYSNWTLYPDYISLDSVCLNFCFPKIQYHMSRLVERVPLGAGDAWRLNCLLPLSSTFKVLTFGTQMHCAHNFVWNIKNNFQEGETIELNAKPYFVSSSESSWSEQWSFFPPHSLRVWTNTPCQTPTAIGCFPGKDKVWAEFESNLWPEISPSSSVDRGWGSG